MGRTGQARWARGGRLAATLLLFPLLPLWVARPEAAPEPRRSEYEVKAAFLYNFAKFVEWPASPPRDAFVVAVLGQDPFGAVLDRMLAGKTVGGRPLVVRRTAAVEEAAAADILFISSSEAEELSALLARLEERPILTVGDMEDFVGRGGMVGFRVVDDVVRFDVNLDRAAKAHLKMSSQLVRVARRVIPAGP